MNTIQTLVIACGNPLRGDDGIGPAAAEIVNSWRIPGVKVIAVHQLTPELIDEMRAAQRVLFVDAAINIEGAFHAGIIAPLKSRRQFGHHQTPANLLALMHDLESHSPAAWQVSISPASFDHGDAISTKAQSNLHAALVWIDAFLTVPPL